MDKRKSVPEAEEVDAKTPRKSNFTDADARLFLNKYLEKKHVFQNEENSVKGRLQCCDVRRAMGDGGCATGDVRCATKFWLHVAGRTSHVARRCIVTAALLDVEMAKLNAKFDETECKRDEL